MSKKVYSMKKKCLFFSVYEEIELDNDLEIKMTADNIKELQNYFNRTEKSLYNLGIRKKKDLRQKITIDNKNYVIIVDDWSENYDI